MISELDVSGPLPTEIEIGVYKDGEEEPYRTKMISVSTDEEVGRHLPHGRPPGQQIQRYLHNARRFHIIVHYENGLCRDWIPNR
jgi:hypothetical protein